MNIVRKRHSLIALAITATCGLALSGHPVSAQITTNFNDTFNNGSTLDAAPAAPTTNSATYQAGYTGTPGTASIAPGDLNLTFPNTTSIGGEIQAQFAASPVGLVNPGDYVDLAITFVATSNVLAGAAASNARLTIGIFNSGGNAPLQGITQYNVGTATTGGTQGWQGYDGQILYAGTSQIYGRGPQTTATSQGQELLFNNASSGGTFNSPLGMVVANKSASTNHLTAATTYTDYIRITLDSATSLTISNALFLGSSDSGSPIYALGGVTNGVSNTSFDGLGFGTFWKGTAQASTELDIDSITVTSFSAVPEPSTLALVGGAIAIIPILRRRRRS